MWDYRETQYFHPLVYGLIASAAVLCAAFAATQLIVGSDAGRAAVLMALCCGLIMLTASMGRMVVEVDQTRLVVRFGWLGLIRRTFDLTRIRSARVCLFRPLREYLGWGWRYGLDGSVCYTTRGRRGLELMVDGQRHIIGSVDPKSLKNAILKVPDEEPADRPAPAGPRPLQLVRRRPQPVSDWGMLQPGDVNDKLTLI